MAEMWSTVIILCPCIEQFILSFSFYITGVSMTPILAMFMSKDAHFYATHAEEARERASVLRDHAAGEEEYEHHGSLHRHHRPEGDGTVGEHSGSTHHDLITGATKEEEFYESMVNKYDFCVYFFLF